MRYKQIVLTCLCLVVTASVVIFALVTLEPRPSLSVAEVSSMTDEQKIANAMTAAPADISRNATIKDWPATEGGEMRVLRKGSSDWLCFPDDPRRDDRDTDVLGLQAQALGDGEDGELRAAVNGASWPDLVAADRREVDDVARLPGPHVGQDGGDAVEHASDVHVNHAVPLVNLEFVQGREWHYAGVVDDHIDLPEALQREIGEGLHVGEVGHVERAVFRCAAIGADLGGDLLEAVGAAGAEYDAGALAGEKAGGSLADAAAGAGD